MTQCAFLFPGQGSQSIAMLDSYAEHQTIITETLDEASSALGYSMSELINTGPAERLNQTEFTQPAILAASIAIYRILHSQGKSCDYVAGHSLGEYSALVAGNALDFATALKLVRTRGQLMQEAVKPGQGKMAAILGADIAALEKLCTQISTDESMVQAANYNSHKQVVISGHASAVDQFVARIDEVSAKKAVVLPVGVPSHCALMQPAADKFAQHMDDITLNPPAVPLLPNVDPSPTTDDKYIRQCLIRQLSSPVLWVKTIEELARLGVGDFIECGPGKVLSGLQRQIIR